MYMILLVWQCLFDVVSLFFLFEYIFDLMIVLCNIYSLLCDGGCLYVIVLNMFINLVDFLVVDYVNYFMYMLLQMLLVNYGFDLFEVDVYSYCGVFVVIVVCWFGDSKVVLVLDV